MARMSPQRPTDRADVMIGFLGAFAALFLVVTVVCETTGRPALTYALILLALVVALGFELRHRARIVRQAGASMRETATGRSDAD